MPAQAAAGPSQIPLAMSNSTAGPTDPGRSSLRGGKLLAAIVGPLASLVVVVAAVLLARTCILRRVRKQRAANNLAEAELQQTPVPMLCLSPNCGHPEHGWKGVIPSVDEVGLALRHQQSEQSLKAEEMGMRVQRPLASPSRSTRGMYGPRPPPSSASKRYVPRTSSARQMLERTLSQYRDPPPAFEEQPVNP
ncbi:hypothetical protein AURDEDRAFT_109889 [Auricularia subglabra TFB-10046 SS5]|nr:hypothetical protein AURDEDRAFT_109889 [Auricularia subglabra TFB-10046 SS5]